MASEDDSVLPQVVINAFRNSVTSMLNPRKVLQLSASNLLVFQAQSSEQLVDIDSLNDLNGGEAFDLIWADLPLGKRPSVTVGTDDSDRRKFPGNWAMLFDTIQYLSNTGIGFFIVEPHGFGTNQGQKFTNILSKSGFTISGIFNAPKGTLEPETALTPVIVAISRSEVDRIFVAELATAEQSDSIGFNFTSEEETSTLEYGMYIEQGSFLGFPQLKAALQIARLETQYHQFERSRLGDIAAEITAVRSGEQHTDKSNSVYIPKLGNSAVLSNLEKTTIKHQNYFQVVLNEHVFNEYVASFFQSAVGQLVIKSLSTGSFIAHINKSDIENAVIALPSITQQNAIVDTHNRLEHLREAIDLLDHEISLNPTSMNHIQQQLDSMLKAVNSLSEPDRIRGIVREGESKRREFKETLSLDVKKQTKEKYIETSALKTVVALLNSDGGTLLIGVADNGLIPGIDHEIVKFHKGNTDNFLKHLKNVLKNRVGEEHYPYFDYQLVSVDEKHILEIECRQAEDPCYLDGSEFYVRTNPATDKLEGPKLVEYVRHRFQS